MINYIITDNVAHDVCKAFNKDIVGLDEYEICELVDIIIDEWLCSRDY